MPRQRKKTENENENEETIIVKSEIKEKVDNKKQATEMLSLDPSSDKVEYEQRRRWVLGF